MRFRPQPLFILFLLFTITAIGLLTPPRTASAAATMDISGGVVTYTAGAYVTNNLTITFDGTYNTFTFSESGETISLGGGATGAGCTGGGTYVVVCPSAGITALTAQLQDRDDTFTLVGSNLPVTVSGGTGNDTITGGDGIDTLNGDAGNDTIVGVKGNDLIAGGEGDDRLIWNNGDGSDTMDGDAGNDTVEVNGADGAGDIFTVVPNGTRTQFDRTNLGLFTLDIDAENLVVNGQGGDDQISGAAGLLDLISMTFNGGADNDTLTGGDGVDALNGDAGNDTIIGFKGNDLIAGGEGDDRLIWNNGDGSDTMDGDAGNDTVEVNGAATAGDSFTIAPNGTRTKFDRINLGLFTLDMDVETLEVNGQDGDDLISVLPLPQTVLALDGGPQSVGDTLTVDPQGATATDTGGVITVEGAAPIHHTNFETITLEDAGSHRLFLPLVGRGNGS